MTTIRISPYPYGKRFALSIVDDTDGATEASSVPIYDELMRHNILVTKTVWAMRKKSISGIYPQIIQEGETLENRSYQQFCERIHACGFEIALHCASAGNSKREDTIRAYDLYEKIFGHSPDTNIMHGRNIENMYWGRYAYRNRLYQLIVSALEKVDFAGHQPQSEYFWGDICKEKTKYIRLFETLKLNTLSFDPATPFHDPNKPYVNWWFSSTYAEGSRLLNLLSDRNIESLADDYGASIFHTYLCRFVRKSHRSTSVIPRFRELIEKLSTRKDGWYVPVNKLLDRLRAIRQMNLRIDRDKVSIGNISDDCIEDVSIALTSKVKLYRMDNSELMRNEYNQYSIGKILPHSTVTFIASKPIDRLEKLREQSPKYLHLVMGHLLRMSWQFAHGRRSLVYVDALSWVKDLVEKK